jgi:hypothetical protein
MPRAESKKWKQLADCLDVIARQIDYPATNQGFCRRKVKFMDDALVEIIRAAQEARSIIRHPHADRDLRCICGKMYHAANGSSCPHCQRPPAEGSILHNSQAQPPKFGSRESMRITWKPF